jgi:hypothetical protein
MFRRSIDVMIVKALRIKSKYHQLTGQASSFLTQIESNPDYKWLTENEGILQPVRDAQNAITSQMTEFDYIMFSGLSSQEIKRQFPDAKDCTL